MQEWTAKEIITYYNNHPGVRLADLARITGRTVSELKYILKGGNETWINQLL